MSKGVFRPATCHPDKRNHGRGYCSKCYVKYVIPLLPKHPEDAAPQAEEKFDKQEVLNFLEASGFTADEAKRAFDAIFLAITTALHSHEEVEVRGFGKWYFRKVPVGVKGHPSTWKGQFGPRKTKLQITFKPAGIFKMLLADDYKIGEWFWKWNPSARRYRKDGH